MQIGANAGDTLENFDAEFDVVVVGYGYAGGISAIEAADAGAKVLLIEKASVPGGISICSYGNVRCAKDKNLAFQYLKMTSGGRTPDDVIRVLADGMVELEDYFRQLGAVSGATISTTEEVGKGGNYPFPGTETFYHTCIDAIPNFDARAAFPWAHSVVGGARTFKVVSDNVNRRNVEVWMKTAAVRLISRDIGESNEVLGVTVWSESRGTMRVKARRAVILCTGGFEGSEEFRKQFWEGLPVLPCAGRSNIGDGIRMAQAVGAQLWHMWHFHGSYGFRHPDPTYPYAIRVKRLPDWTPGREHEAKVKMAWILLDQNGKRYMNEYQPYTQDTSYRPTQYFDPATQSYPRNPSILLCDENGRKMYPLGRPVSNDEGLRFEWSEDNMKEVELGILKRANSIAELARMLGVNPASAENSIARWNAQCDKGVDEDFGRPGGAMTRIDTPPFYGAPVWSLVSNTQGGPVHNAKQEITDVFGKQIPRLYAAGELGSSFGHLYLSGSNISECFLNGRTAGRNAAALPAWTDASVELDRVLSHQT